MPAPAVRLVVPAHGVLPGAVPHPRWPTSGEATVEVAGVGSFGSTGTTQVPIGSVAKVMTAYLVLGDHPLTGTEPGPTLVVSPSDVADYRSRAPSGQSVLPVTAGESLTERQALEALLIPSANNVADMLAAWDAGSITAFVGRMNAAAARLGLSATRYTDPSGLLPSTVSTASDQVALAERAMSDPTFAGIVVLPSVQLPGLGTATNYNSLLGELGTVGVKTGSTDTGGGSLVFAARHPVGDAGTLLVGAVLNADTGAPALTALAAAISASRALLGSVEPAVARVTVAHPGTAVAELVPAWARPVPAVTAGELAVTGWGGLGVTTAVRPHPGGATPPTGTRVATITARAGAARGETALVTGAPVPAPSLWWRLIR